LVKIRAACLQAYRLPLRDLWLSAVGEFAWRTGWLLRLETDDGRYGYGDCAPLVLIGTESCADAESALRARSQQMIGSSVNDALAALNLPATVYAPAARCALECALLDLQAQVLNLPLRYALLPCSGMSDEVVVNAALGSLMLASDESILTACTQGFSVLKFKVGSIFIKNEIDRLRSVSDLLPSGIKLRLDANRAWSEAEATNFIAHCTDLPVDMLEEPLADPTPAVLQRLQANCEFPLALDESWPGNFALDAFFATPPVCCLVLKPPRLGGLLPALALARRAKTAGIQCVVTSCVDSACGVLAAAQLAAVLDSGLKTGSASVLVHGLATSIWLAKDTGIAPKVSKGRLRLPDTHGLGFVPLDTVNF
jgi:o-succinylbenzoate synthase